MMGNCRRGLVVLLTMKALVLLLLAACAHSAPPPPAVPLPPPAATPVGVLLEHARDLHLTSEQTFQLQKLDAHLTDLNEPLESDLVESHAAHADALRQQIAANDDAALNAALDLLDDAQRDQARSILAPPATSPDSSAK
jgi:hypothetical protein